MSAAGFTPIQLYRTTTASAVPSAGNLADGELAINLTDEALYFKNASGVVTLLADSSGALGSVTSVNASGGTTGLTFSGGPITSSGTLTLGGTLAVANGGTGVTTSTGTGSVVLSTSPTLVTPVLGVASATSLNVTTGQSVGWGNDQQRIVGANDPSTLQFFTGNAERMRIDSSGNVGIGTSSPGVKLDVSGTAQANNFLLNPTAGTVGYSDNSANVVFFNGTGAFGITNASVFHNGGSERMRIVSDGAVGIGLSAPNATLHLQGIKGGNGRMTQSFSGSTSQDNLNLIASSNSGGGEQWFSYGVSSANYYFIQNGVNAGSSGLVIRNDNRVMVGTATGFDATVGANFMAFGSAGSAAAFKVDGASTTQVSFYDNTQSARVGWIGTVSSTTSYNTTSDRRLKKNIQPVADVGDKIDQMEVVSHQWTNGTEAVIPYGFIAQDLHKIAPHAVSAGDEGEEVAVEWAVDYSKLVPMLVKEVQSLRARVAQLEGN